VKIAQLLRVMRLTERMNANVPVHQIEYSKCNSGETFSGNAIMDSKTKLQAYPDL